MEEIDYRSLYRRLQFSYTGITDLLTRERAVHSQGEVGATGKGESLIEKTTGSKVAMTRR
jgi:hypothetical protein